MSTVQDTRLSRVQGRVGERLLLGFRGPWLRVSLVLLAVLVGFFLGSNVTEYIGESIALALRSVAAFIFMVMVEILIRLRFRFAGSPVSLTWQVIDNLRIGFTYALALEAFKVGS
ncbi:MAG: DUF565 domain-containing protein [Cyanobacteriota bacterium]|nr:DUF565 domain-containing protein [Cyanobacteriota bacterium]